MADLQTIKIRDLIETQTVLTTDYMILEKDTGTFKCEARYLKGATGTTPNVQVGNTTTLSPGLLATVTQRGNLENPIFDFGIPQGVQGPIGPQGEKGDTPDITPLQTQIDNRFNSLTSQQQGDSEVIDARGGYPALKDRLDAINDDLIKYNDQTIVTRTTESNFSSIDATKNGYLDNILLEGKTLVVDSNNQVVLPGTQGAILKSVGDGVTEIKLNSLNKNLYYGTPYLTGTNKDTVILDKFFIGDIGDYYISVETSTQYRANSIYLTSSSGNYNRLVGTISTSGKIAKSLINITSDDIKCINNNNDRVFKIYKSGTDTVIPNNVIISKGSNYIPYEENEINTKKVLYKDTDGTWKKPTLRQWDSIEKHSDDKYYYHKRSTEFIIDNNITITNIEILTNTNKVQYDTRMYKLTTNLGTIDWICDELPSLQGSDDILHCRIDGSQPYGNFITWLDKSYGNDKNTILNNLSIKPIKVVSKLKEEEVFECTPIDLISYDSQTNYSIECGPIYPKTTLKVNSYLGNVVSILKDKVSYLENMLVDGLKLVVAGNMQELAYQLYPQDFVDNSVNMEVIE